MKSFILLLLGLLLPTFSWAQSLITVNDVKMDEDRIVLLTDNGASQIDISPSIYFDYATRKLVNADATLLQNQDIVLSADTYRRFMRLYPEASWTANWADRFGQITNDNNNVHVRLLWGLKTSTSPISLNALQQKVLGCEDSGTHYCLGITHAVSNPNLLLLDSQEDPKTVPALTMTPRDLPTRENAETLFKQAQFPEALSRWMALSLEIRKAHFTNQAAKAQALQQELAQLNAAPSIVNGEIRSDFPGFQVDFTVSRMDSAIKAFLKYSANDLQSMAQYMLAHAPYMNVSNSKWKIGNVAFGGGFMVRMKRKISSNMNAQSPDQNFLVRDSIEIFASFTAGAKVHPFTGLQIGAGVGPAYFRNWEVTHFAVSNDEAEKGYWGIPMAVMLHSDLSSLKPDQQMTTESGWAATANVLVSSIRVLTFKPQINTIANLRWISRKFASRNQDGSMYVGIAHGRDFDLNIMAMMKSLVRVLRIPFFTYEYVTGPETGKSFLIPVQNVDPNGLSAIGLQNAFDSGNSTLLAQYFPSADLEVAMKTSNMFMNWLYGNASGSSLQMKVHVYKDVNEKTWIDHDHNFLVFENNSSGKNVFSVLHSPASLNCSAWLGADIKEPLENTALLYRAKCFYGYGTKDPLREYDLNQNSSLLQVDLNSLWDPKTADLKKVLTTEVELGPEILKPILLGQVSGWIADFKNEIEQARKLDASTIPVDIAKERFFLYTTLGMVLQQKTPQDRLRTFFASISSSGANEVFMQSILRRNPKALRHVEMFTPAAEQSDKIETSLQAGQATPDSGFQFLINRNKWLGE